MKPLHESELIITNEGAIYHLNLRPEHLADTVITVGDPGRVAQVSAHFDSIEHRAQHREFITHTGYVGRKRISVISTGIGTGNIDIVLNELDALANINFDTRTPNEDRKGLTIIRLGTCGSLHESAPVDALIASSYSIGLDNLLHYYKLESSDNAKTILTDFMKDTCFAGGAVVPYIAEGAAELLSSFSGMAVAGITVSCPGFYAPQGRILIAQPAFSNITQSLAAFRSEGHFIANLEMETAAIYGLGRVLEHSCLSVSTVLANRLNNTFSTDVSKSVENMILRSLEVIEQL